jgi:aryl-alcohol dehydrogenase-like predicted oxidoreductase
MVVLTSGNIDSYSDIDNIYFLLWKVMGIRGRSEEILGECIAHERDNIVLTTKVFWNTSADVNGKGLSRKHMMQGVEASFAPFKNRLYRLLFCS